MAVELKERAAVKRRTRRRGGFLRFVLLLAALVLLAGAAYKLTDGFAGLHLPVRVDESNIAADFDVDYGRIEAMLTADMYTYEATDADIAALRRAAEKNPEHARSIDFLIEHIGAYSQTAVNSIILSPEKTDFVLLAPLWRELGGGAGEGLSVKKGETPFFIQYDSRWAFLEYGSSCIGNTACGPTCLAMAAAGLTGDDEYTPDKLSVFAEDNGYYVPGVGTAWNLFTDGAAALGLRGAELSGGREPIVEALKNGGVVVASMLPGDFTMAGHFVVIYDWGLAGFKLNDPSSVERSAQTWTWRALAPQIAQCWAIYES